MATYETWNNALLNYSLAGVPKGTRVYLAIDDEAIAWIAHDLETSENDFSEVVRLRCLNNGVIRLDRIYADMIKDYNAPPRYFAFLCGMVLAAHRMGENEDSSHNDYFTYLNGLLRLGISGRPPGLEHGAEEALWKDWAFWLRYNQFQPTAIKTGDHYYTYALSQAMLRGLDKNHLWQHFGNNSGKYLGRPGKGELTAQLRADAKLTNSRFSKHLRELLNTEGKIGATRYDDLAEALDETFDAWVENGRPRERAKTYQAAAPSSIRAGLYRTEDYLSGEVSYYLLPRQPRHIQATEAIVTYDGKQYPLLPDRKGWFEPLPFPLSLPDIENGFTLPLHGIDRIRALTINASDFWILPPDPDDVDSGVYASWTDHPELGIIFVLLCRPNLKNDMEVLRSEMLINWNHETTFDGWIEYSGVMVLSDVWTEVKVDHKELINQLRPRMYLGVALRGGLRDTKSGAWLVGCYPEVIVNAFAKQVSLTLVDLSDESTVCTIESLKSGNIVPIEWPSEGDYMLRVQGEGQQYERFVRIINWDAIQIATKEQTIGLKIGESSLCGAFIEAGERNYE